MSRTISCCAVPSFLISYKFNPPDDDTPNDIVHTIRTHIAPNGKINVGDALPILYTQSTLGNIRSMPFPFPLNDLALPDDYHHHITLEATPEIEATHKASNHNLMKDSETTIEIAPVIDSPRQHIKRSDVDAYLDQDADCKSKGIQDLEAIEKLDTELFQTY